MFFDPPLLLPKTTLLTSGHLMYFCVTEQLDFQYYIKEFDLPDTLNSYFILVTLHIWLCTVRLANQGSEGEIVRNSMVEIMWSDIEEKGKNLVQSKASTSVRQALEKYNNTLLYMFLSLDEGLLSDDKTLAGAVWRTIYEQRDNVDPEKIELLVYYIRKQVHHIERIDSFKLLSKGVVQFLNIHGDKVNDRFLRMAKQQQKL
ncbi:hypothetical protein LOTGIDRAFT_108143 [Lottia gigantea]|uniref:Ubiquinol-cytochrome c chaperone domain-containing protein n=1 Tax=Lottia gigantea TaxID=225164 RepID=V4B6F8_LOTGI|nr:hypothetical protein LOTGIDRAFT_108143 [Lottia gigantea]ESO84119.1 hypothetical protein LOTGIDRAFT_108143 [Lottia gigantea]